MGWNPFKKSSWTKVGNAIVDTGKQAADATAAAAKAAADATAKAAADAAAEAKRQADAAAKAAADAAAEAKRLADAAAKATADAAAEAKRQADAAAKATADAYNATKDFAVSLANDTAKAVEHTASVVAKNTEEYAKQGFDVTSDAWKEGSSQVIQYTKEGVVYVEFAATEAYKWADANACYVGLNLALTTGCVMYFTPKPAPGDPGTVTSTAISASYLASMAAVQGSNIAMAMAVGELITQGFMLIPGVKGNVDEKMLNRVIVNAIATCNPYVLSVSLATPAGVGIFIGSVISPIVAQLICDKTVPKGLSNAI